MTLSTALVEAVQAALDSEDYEDRTISVREIVRQVATKHGLTVQDILSESRTKSIVRARSEAMYRCTVETGYSFARIGRAMGGKDRCSVIHAIRRYAKRQGLPLPRGMTAGSR